MPTVLKILIVAACCVTIGLVLSIIDAGLSPLVGVMAVCWAVLAGATVRAVINDRRRRA
ncbi:hypothetical protein [Streptomyces griseoluteus]|uniref:hypothetical protein n=1 Tax=Streptomyces griseoluteus TaxID=29306 RepID=UPI0036E1E4DC